MEEATSLTARPETALTFVQAISLYRRATFWAVFFCLGQLMTAYDPQVMGNLLAMPAFQRDFGHLYKGEYTISAAWQTGLMMGVPIGQVVGSLGAGYPMEWFGRKRTFGVCVIGTIGCIFIQFFSQSLQVLLVGELVGGLVLGFYAVITPAYASEVCPVALRGILTANINLSIVVGQFLANVVCAGTQKLDSHWAYRLPFALQWFWPVIILIGLPFAPESSFPTYHTVCFHCFTNTGTASRSMVVGQTREAPRGREILEKPCLLQCQREASARLHCPDEYG